MFRPEAGLKKIDLTFRVDSACDKNSILEQTQQEAPDRELLSSSLTLGTFKKKV